MTVAKNPQHDAITEFKIRFCCYRSFLFFIRILTFSNRKYKYHCLYFSFITYNLYIRASKHFCDRHFAIGDHFNCTILLFRKWLKKSYVLCRNFISICKIKRTLHGRLGIWILSSRAESISHSFALLTLERYFQRLKIKFVSPRGHVISSISSFHKKTLHFANRSRSKSTVLSAIYNEVQVGPNEFSEFNVPNVNVRNTRKL